MSTFLAHKSDNSGPFSSSGPNRRGGRGSQNGGCGSRNSFQHSNQNFPSYSTPSYKLYCHICDKDGHTASVC